MAEIAMFAGILTHASYSSTVHRSSAISFPLNQFKLANFTLTGRYFRVNMSCDFQPSSSSRRPVFI